MAKRQTRRSISVRGVTYQQLRAHCAVASMSISDFIEQRIADYFSEHPPLAAPAPLPAPLAVASRPAPVARLVEKPVERRPAPAARIEPAVVAVPRPVPATSTLVNRPMPAAARRAVSPVQPSAPAPAIPFASVPSEQAQAKGRPAPTPAAQVLKDRMTPAAPRDAKDYRAIRF